MEDIRDYEFFGTAVLLLSSCTLLSQFLIHFEVRSGWYKTCYFQLSIQGLLNSEEKNMINNEGETGSETVSNASSERDSVDKSLSRSIESADDKVSSNI
jgi:hypothetical protein